MLVRRAGVLFALLVAALLACAPGGRDEDDNNFRPDVIECEDALDRLKRCCASFDPTPVVCQHHYEKSSGCGATTVDSVEPAFTTDESRCIRDASCDVLVRTRVCDRAQAARTYEHHETTYDDAASPPDTMNQTHAPVCP
ncbi:MAG TPA: hypothetical protein VIF62_10805 [Labilithrix sp.]